MANFYLEFLHHSPKKIHGFKQTWAILYLERIMWELRISTGYIEIIHLYASKNEALVAVKKAKLDKDKDYSVRRVHINA